MERFPHPAELVRPVFVQTQRPGATSNAYLAARLFIFPQVFDPYSDRWTDLAPMRARRTGVALAQGPCGRLYAVGACARPGPQARRQQRCRRETTSPFLQEGRVPDETRNPSGYCYFFSVRRVSDSYYLYVHRRRPAKLCLSTRESITSKIDCCHPAAELTNISSPDPSSRLPTSRRRVGRWVSRPFNS